MSILVIAEHDNTAFSPVNASVLKAALALGDDISILIAGHNCAAVAEQASCLQGVKQVLLVQDVVYQHGLAENLATLIVELGQSASHILAPATTFGKNVMPRVAALLDVMQISDICAVQDEATFVRPIYAGNALATVKSHDPIKVITVRGTAFAAVESGAPQPEMIQTQTKVIENPHSHFIQIEASESDRPELTSAKVIISGGRGLQNKDNFSLIERLATKLNAAIGASRAAVDAGFVPNDCQVGQTGKIVAPDLYIAVGISGAIQHLAGMKDSKVIVAINKDEDAPIFQIADYGLVADLFEVLPQFEQALDQLNSA